MFKSNEYYFKFKYNVLETGQRITECYLLDDEKRFVKKQVFVENTPINVLQFATAICNKDDNFNKSIGRKLALERLMILQGWDKETRRRIWNDYFKTHKKR